MQPFHYINNQLYGEDVPLIDIAENIGTPCYVYSYAALQKNWDAFNHAFQGVDYRICYAVKANSSLAILQFFKERGAGFDIVSQGELERVLAVKSNPANIIFSGVGKSVAEIEKALAVDVGCFDVESHQELERINAIAKRKNKIATIALRVNPDVDARTHPYISTGMSMNKFGIAEADIIHICQFIQTLSHVRLAGLASHIGSQLTSIEPFLLLADKMLALKTIVNDLGFELQFINLGGGLGVIYYDETPPTFIEYADALKKKIKGHNIQLIFEPGRALVAAAGILLTKVEYIKRTGVKNFAIVDAGMNDLMRPALYEAWHDVLPLKMHYNDMHLYDIVGPVCESTDVLAKGRQIAIEQGDTLAVKDVGAYGFSMSSNYNSRPKPAEVMIKEGEAVLIRKRETFEDLFLHEKMLKSNPVHPNLLKPIHR